MRSLESILAKHPFFENLNEEHMALITGCASNARFNSGEFIYRHDEEANSFFIIREGKVALEICPPGKSPVIVQTVSDGEVLGWAWIVPPFHWQFDAQAVELTRAIVLDGKCLRNKCSQDPGLGYEILSRLLPVIGKSMEATRMQLLDIYRINK
ncbi:MAG: cyclic nucleotide-binding domain-containing protein [Nitrospinota bacterium]